MGRDRYAESYDAAIATGAALPPVFRIANRLPRPFFLATMAAGGNQRVSAKATGIIGLAVMSSRVLGLLREMIFAGLFGAGRNLDAFLMAFRVPNLLRDLFAEGALSTAFITTFSKRIALEGDESAWTLANKVATLTAIFMSAVTLIGIALARPLINVMTWWSWSPEKTELTVQLTRIMWPFILLVAMAALVMGMLNAKHVFGPPAMASTFFNLGSIIAGVGVGYWLDPHFGPRALSGLAVGTLVGGLWQLLAQLPALRRVGYRFRPDFMWRDPGVRTVLALMAPAVIAASAVQVNVLVNSGFAARLGDGPVSWLNIAFRLMQLPLGIFGVAVATVTLPLISRSAAQGNTEEFRGALAHALRLVMLLTIPSAIGLMIMAEPIISLIYQHGRFTAESTAQTAGALRFYAIGLVGYSAVKVLAPAFYALDRRNLPMLVSIASIAVNALLNWLLTFRMGLGHRGLALSTSLVAVTNFAALYIMMRRYAGRLETRAMLETLAKLAAAGACLAAVSWTGVRFFFPTGVSQPLAWRLLGVSATIAAAGLVFFAVAYLLRVPELQDMVAVVRKKLRR
ncbi:MAG: murein biosynthesis integral membrane protein MurJ [Verrucomicrobiota bacterium]|nr:murein biosynthesis integral membrane protein MurJ [Verrucomicrobiota bacterium]